MSLLPFKKHPLYAAILTTFGPVAITGVGLASAQEDIIIAEQPTGNFIFLSDSAKEFPDGGTLRLGEGITQIAILHDYFDLGPKWTLFIDGTLTGDNSTIGRTTLRNGGELNVSATGVVNNVLMVDGGVVSNQGVISGTNSEFGGEVAIESNRDFQTSASSGTTSLEITNEGSITADRTYAIFAYELDTISINNSGTIAVNENEKIAVSTDYGVAAIAVGGNESTTIVNSGTIDAGTDADQATTAILAISGGYASSTEGYVFSGGTGDFQITNEATGTITGERIFDNTLAGAPSDSYSLTLVNDGSLIATGDDSATAAIISSGATEITNNGSLVVTGSGSAIDHQAGTGSLAEQQLVLVNNGEISSTSGAATIVTNAASITNTGSITSSHEGTELEAVLLLIESAGSTEDELGNSITIDNSGTLQAGPDELTASSGVVLTTDSSSAISFLNSGTVIGQLELSVSDDTLENTGSIAADSISLDAGNDVLTNAGSISAQTLSFGEGSDLLTVSGTLDVATTTLGAGDDQLTAEDGATVSGNVDAGTGTDSLELNGSGNSDAIFSNFESTAVNGDWTLTGEGSSLGDINLNAGELVLGNNTLFTSLTIGADGSIGLQGEAATITNSGSLRIGDTGSAEVLTIDGDFSMSASGTLTMDALEDGTSDQILVTGTATIDGSLETLSNDSNWSVDQTYRLLSAEGGLNGEFSAVTNNLEYLIPTLEYSANDVLLTLARRNEAIQGDILETTNAQQLSVVTRIVPAVIQNHVSSSVASKLGLTGAVASLMTQRAPTGLSAGDQSEDLKNSVWLNIAPSRYDQYATLPGIDVVTKLDGESINFMLGMDRTISDNFILGGFIGYEDSRVDMREIDGRQENDGLMLGAYAGITFTDWLYASANGHWASLSNSLEERAFNSLTPVQADFDSERYGIGIDLNAMTALGNLALHGQVAYNYGSETYDRYTSSTGEEVALDDADLGRFSATAELSYAGDNWSPYISATYEKDTSVSDVVLDDDGFLINAGLRFYGATYSFEAYVSSVEGRDNENHYMIGLNGSLLF